MKLDNLENLLNNDFSTELFKLMKNYITENVKRLDIIDKEECIDFVLFKTYINYHEKKFDCENPSGMFISYVNFNIKDYMNRISYEKKKYKESIETYKGERLVTLKRKVYDIEILREYAKNHTKSECCRFFDCTIANIIQYEKKYCIQFKKFENEEVQDLMKKVYDYRMRGHTYKECQKTFNLSARTTESYILKMKKRYESIEGVKIGECYRIS